LTFGFLIAFAPARSAQSNAASVVQSCAVIERGWDYRIWQVARAWPAPAGQVFEVHTNYYTELQTGLNYLRNGQWLESAEKIVAYRNGPAASQGPHTAVFGPSLLSPPSAVTLIMLDGTWLPSTPAALVYHDPLNGTSVTIAAVQDSPVEVLPPNQVIYRNAFANLTADIRYTYTRAGLEQDVILRSNLPSPARYGLNPATTRLEVWT